MHNQIGIESGRFLESRSMICHLKPSTPSPAIDIATGAATWGFHLFVATLRCTDRGFEIDRNRSHLFNLFDRHQNSMIGFRDDLHEFARLKQIHQILMRARPNSGPHLPKPVAYKMEAAVQLIPGAKVTLVDTRSVISWEKREEPDLPEPIEKSASPRRAELLAIETAAFSIMHAGNPKYFKDGDVGHA